MGRKPHRITVQLVFTADLETFPPPYRCPDEPGASTDFDYDLVQILCDAWYDLHKSGDVVGYEMYDAKVLSVEPVGEDPV